MDYINKKQILGDVMKESRENIDYDKALLMLSNYLFRIRQKTKYQRTGAEMELVEKMKDIYQPFLDLSRQYRELEYIPPLLLEMDLDLKKALYEFTFSYRSRILRANNFIEGESWDQITTVEPPLSWDQVLEDEDILFPSSDATLKDESTGLVDHQDGDEDEIIEETARFEKIDRILDLLDYVQAEYDLAGGKQTSCDTEVQQIILELKTASNKIMPAIKTNIRNETMFEEDFFSQLSEPVMERLDSIAHNHKNSVQEFKAKVAHFMDERLDNESATTQDKSSSDSEGESPKIKR